MALASHAEAGIEETFILLNRNDDGRTHRLKGGGQVLEKESTSLRLYIEDPKGYESYPAHCLTC